MMIIKEKNQDPDFKMGGRNLMSFIAITSDYFQSNPRDLEVTFVLTDKMHDRISGFTYRISSLHVTARPDGVKSLIKFQGRHNSISTSTRTSRTVIEHGIVGLHYARGGVAILEGNYNYSGDEDIYTSPTRLGHRFLSLYQIRSSAKNSRVRKWAELGHMKLAEFIKKKSIEAFNKIKKEFLDQVVSLNPDRDMNYDKFDSYFGRTLTNAISFAFVANTPQYIHYYEELDGQFKLPNPSEFYKRIITPLQIRYYKEYMEYNSKLLTNFIRLYSAIEIKRITENIKNFSLDTDEYKSKTKEYDYDEIVLSNYRIKYFVLTDVIETYDMPRIKELLEMNNIPHRQVNVLSGPSDATVTSPAAIEEFKKDIVNYLTSYRQAKVRSVEGLRNTLRITGNVTADDKEMRETLKKRYKRDYLTVLVINQLFKILERAKDYDTLVSQVEQVIYRVDDISNNAFAKKMVNKSNEETDFYTSPALSLITQFKMSRYYVAMKNKKDMPSEEQETLYGWQALENLIKSHLSLPRKVQSTKKVVSK